MIQEDSESIFKKEIKSLYIETFSNGISAQHIDHEKLNDLLDLTYEKGKMIVSVNQQEVDGAAFLFPLSFDTSFPISEHPYLESARVMYFAELLVDERYRGQGIGSQIILFTSSLLKNEGFNYIIIRVWDKNEAALHLYQKNGFKEICRIKQSKKTVDLSDDIEMTKIYLLKQF